MSGIVAGYFPHIPFVRSLGSAGVTAPRMELADDVEREPNKRGRRRAVPKHAAPPPLSSDDKPKLLGIRATIMGFVKRFAAQAGEGPTMTEIEGQLGGEAFLAQNHVYWLEGHGFLKADRGPGGRRRLSPTSKEWKP